MDFEVNDKVLINGSIEGTDYHYVNKPGVINDVFGGGFYFVSVEVYPGVEAPFLIHKKQLKKADGLSS